MDWTPPRVFFKNVIPGELETGCCKNVILWGLGIQRGPDEFVSPLYLRIWLGHRQRCLSGLGGILPRRVSLTIEMYSHVGARPGA